MPLLLLTDLSVRSLKAERRTDFWCTKTPGFGIRVGANTKTFIAKVNNRRHTIGKYPTVSLHDARKKALALKAAGDTRTVSAPTLEEAYEKFKLAHIVNKRAKTQSSYKRVIEKYFMPRFAKTRLPNITYEAITAITDRLADVPSEQAHVLGVGRTFFRWCTRPPRRFIPHSPLEGVQIILGKPRTRVLTDQELATVWQAADAQGSPHGAAVKLLILTGQRKGEIGSLRRSWIDEQKRTVTFPDTVTKNRSEHTLPYGDMAAAIFDAIPRRNSSDFLFPSRWDGDVPFSGWSKSKDELGDGCAHWTLHDLRRTFATKLAELRVPPHIVERLLNHKLGSISNKANSIVSAVAEVYIRAQFMPEMREAIEKWEAYLASLLAEAKGCLPAGQDGRRTAA